MATLKHNCPACHQQLEYYHPVFLNDVVTVGTKVIFADPYIVTPDKLPITLIVNCGCKYCLRRPVLLIDKNHIIRGVYNIHALGGVLGDYFVGYARPEIFPTCRVSFSAVTIRGINMLYINHLDHREAKLARKLYHAKKKTT